MDIACPKCAKRLRVPDETSGKQVRCPQCKAPFTVPAAGGAVAAGSAKGGSSSSGGWRVQTEDGQKYGPVSKAELDGWVADGRLDAQCQLLQEGWDQWQWADDVYPQLKTAGSSGGFPLVVDKAKQPAAISGIVPFGAGPGGNPYVAPAPASSSIHSNAGGEEKLLPGIRRAMAGTAPWVLFLAILAFIGVALVALSLLVLVLISLASGRAQAVLFTMVFSFIYFVMIAVLAGLPAWLLLRYNLAIGRFLRSGSQKTLQAAVEAQQRYWMTMGIIVIVWIVLSVMGWLIMLAAGAGAAGGLMRGL